MSDYLYRCRGTSLHVAKIMNYFWDRMLALAVEPEHISSDFFMPIFEVQMLFSLSHLGFQQIFDCPHVFFVGPEQFRN